MTFTEFAESSVWLNYLDTQGCGAFYTAQLHLESGESHLARDWWEGFGRNYSAGDRGFASEGPDIIEGVQVGFECVYQLRTMSGVADENDLIPRSPVRKKLHRPVHFSQEKPYENDLANFAAFCLTSLQLLKSRSGVAFSRFCTFIAFTLFSLILAALVRFC